MKISTKDVKTCTKCEQAYPNTEHFFRAVKGKNGKIYICGECIVCAKQRIKKHRKDNIDHYKEKRRQHYLKNREKNIKYSVNWNRENKDARKRITKKYNSLHKRIATSKELEYINKWRALNREKVAKYKRKTYETHKSAWKTYKANRRSREKGTLSKNSILRQYKQQEGLCYYCLAPVENNYHLDHYIPLSRGGVNTEINIVISCKACNLVKGAKLPSEFKQLPNVNPPPAFTKDLRSE